MDVHQGSTGRELPAIPQLIPLLTQPTELPFVHPHVRASEPAAHTSVHFG